MLKKLLPVLLLGLLLSACRDTPAQLDSLATPPNIIFIMTDDHAFQAISAYDQFRKLRGK